MDTSTKDELLHTGTIGAVGLGTGMLSAKIGHAIPKIGKSVLAAGALSGGLGLIGDYGAVKLNKKLSMKKQASDNKYLEKIAETYTVNGHSGYGMFPTPKVNLDREQYHQYAEEVDGSARPFATGAVVGGLTGALAAHLAKQRGGSAGKAGLLVGGLGYLAGSAMGRSRVHDDALEKLKIMHPSILNMED